MSAAGEARDVEFGFAQEDDFNQVVKLCSKDDFNGLDYLPAIFHSWLREPGRLTFLGRINTRVVGLESALLVDGGQTVVLQGFRITPDWRGRGIGGALQSHVINYIRSHYPEVSVVRLTRGDQPSAQILDKKRVIAKEAILSLCCEVTDLRPFIDELRSKLSLQADSSPSGAVRLSQQQAETLILSDHVISNLLPGKTIICDWEPLKPMESNMEVLRRRQVTWIVDRESEPSAMSLSKPPFAVPYRHDALRFNISINIFGHRLSSVCSVFLAQLEASLPRLRDNVVVYTSVDPAVWPELRQFCQNNANVSFFKDYWEEVLVETDI